MPWIKCLGGGGGKARRGKSLTVSQPVHLIVKVNEDTEATLEWPDYLVMAVVLGISASIGIYYRFSGGRQKTAEEYFSANHSMGIPLLSVAMAIALLSAIAMLGGSAEMYNYGAYYFIMNVGFIIGTPIAAFFYIPVFYNLQNMSVYEYLQRRFGSTARLSASIANFAQMCMHTGIVLYAPALAIEATYGLSSTTSILLMGLICTFYSSIGGLKAVLATDIFQGALMFATIFCIIAIGCYDINGGISAVMKIATEGGRLDVSNFDPDPTIRHTWWTLTIGGVFNFLVAFGVSQIQMQRLLSARSLKAAQISLFLNTAIIIIMYGAVMISAFVLYAWFEGCDPVASGRIASLDQIMPYFAKIRLSKIPGLLGFFIAGIFSASLSTISATMNSLSAVAISDYVKPIFRKANWQLTETKSASLGKILSILIGLSCVAIAFLISGFGSLVHAVIGINGAIGGPLLGLFTLGLFFESANEIGSVIGTVLGMILTMWMAFGRPKPPVQRLPVSVEACPNSTYYDAGMVQELVDSRNADDSGYFYLYRVSYMLYTPLGMASVVLFGYVASTVVHYFNKNTIEEPDPDLFTPLVAARIIKRRGKNSKTTASQEFVIKDEQSALPEQGQ